MNEVFQQGATKLFWGKTAGIEVRCAFGVLAASAVFFCQGWTSIALILVVVGVIIFDPFSARGWVILGLTILSAVALYCLDMVGDIVGGQDWLKGSSLFRLPIVGGWFESRSTSLADAISTFFAFFTQLSVSIFIIKIMFNSCSRSELFEYSKSLHPRIKLFVQPIIIGWVMFYLFSTGLFSIVHENLVARGCWPSRERCSYYGWPIVGPFIGILHCIIIQFIYIYLTSFMFALAVVAFDRGQNVIVATNTRLHVNKSYTRSRLSEHNRTDDFILIMAAVLIVFIAGHDYVPRIV